METAPGETISLSLRLGKAMTLARSGRLRDAQLLIAGERTIPDHPLELEALASLVTSEGDYLRALKLWELLLQREPQHSEAKRMIDQIELWLLRPGWMRHWQLGLSTALAIVGALVVWVVAASGGGKPSPSPVVTPSSSNYTSSPGLYESRPTSPRPTTAPAPSYTKPAPVVTFPGVKAAPTAAPKKKSNTSR